MNDVAIVGNVNQDLVLAPVSDYPQWGTESTVAGYALRPGGSGANTALALAALGVSPALVANVGDDQWGREMISELRRSGIDTSRVRITPGVQTSLSVGITRAEPAERSFITTEGNLCYWGVQEVQEEFEFLAGCGAVLFCGYFLLPRLQDPRLAEMLRRLKTYRLKGRAGSNRPRGVGPILLLDTGWDTHNWRATTRGLLKELLSIIDVFLPNEVELLAVAGMEVQADADWGKIDYAAKTVLGMGPKAVVVKLGAQGSAVFAGNNAWHILPVTLPVTDTVGAGDYFNAGFIYGLRTAAVQNGEEAIVSHARLITSARYGSAVATLNISRTPSRKSMVTRDEVEAFLAHVDAQRVC